MDLLKSLKYYVENAESDSMSLRLTLNAMKLAIKKLDWRKVNAHDKALLTYFLFHFRAPDSELKPHTRWGGVECCDAGFYPQYAVSKDKTSRLINAIGSKSPAVKAKKIRAFMFRLNSTDRYFLERIKEKYAADAVKAFQYYAKV